MNSSRKREPRIKCIGNIYDDSYGGSGWKDSNTGMALTTPHVLIQYGNKIKF